MTKSGAGRLHLGCGLQTPAGWIHVDGSWNARLAQRPLLRRVLKTLRLAPAGLLEVPWSRDLLIHDLREPLPFPGHSFRAIYCSHTLEHLYLEEARRLLQECLRVLCARGVLRMVVPDVRTFVNNYLRQQGSAWPADPDALLSPADRLCQDLHFRNPRPEPGGFLYRLFYAINDIQLHKWMYDGDSLVRHFEWAGFTGVSAMEMHRSRIEGIEEIEVADRAGHGAGVSVEGVRPEAPGG